MSKLILTAVGGDPADTVALDYGPVTSPGTGKILFTPSNPASLQG